MYSPTCVSVLDMREPWEDIFHLAKLEQALRNECDYSSSHFHLSQRYEIEKKKKFGASCSTAPVDKSATTANTIEYADSKTSTYLWRQIFLGG